MADEAGNKPAEESRKTFGRYEVLGSLRSDGPFVETFLASQTGLDRKVELRVLKIPGGEGGPLFERFMREVRILATVDHPGVIPVLDVGVVGGHAYFTTTHRESVTLERYRMDHGGRLAEAQVIAFAETLADALARLHGEGLVLRCLSPRSILVDPTEETPYLGDCSAIKDVRDQSCASVGMPRIDELLPTPELLTGRQPDARTDVFLLGAVLYELLSGTPAVPVPADGDVMTFLREARAGFPQPPPLDRLLAGPGPVRGFHALVMRCIALSPEERPESATVLADELRSLAEQARVRLIIRHDADRSRQVSLPPPTKAPQPQRRKAAAAQAPKPAWSVPPAAILGGGLLLLLLAALVSFGGSGGGALPTPAPTPTRGTGSTSASGIASADLVALAGEVRARPTDRSTFLDRSERLRRWLATGPGTSAPCTYSQLMELRFRFTTTAGDETAAKLDGWILEAGERGGPGR